MSQGEERRYIVKREEENMYIVIRGFDGIEGIEGIEEVLGIFFIFFVGILRGCTHFLNKNRLSRLSRLSFSRLSFNT